MAYKRTAARGDVHGIDLKLYPTLTMGWGDWKQRHPGTLILERPRCDDGSTEDRQGCNSQLQRDQDRTPYGGYVRAAKGVEGLHPKDHVLGLALDHRRQRPSTRAPTLT